MRTHRSWGRLYCYLKHPVGTPPTSPKQMKPAPIICYSAAMAAMAALLQSSMVLLPGFGQLLGAFSSFPIAFASLLHPASGLLTVVAAAVVVTMIHPVGGILLLLTTGPLGLMIGTTIRLRWPRALGILLSTLALFLGITFLTRLTGIEAFNLLRLLDLQGGGIIIAICLLVYTWLWFDLVEYIYLRLGDWTHRAHWK